jgi:hypothetical protein
VVHVFHINTLFSPAQYFAYGMLPLSVFVKCRIINKETNDSEDKS